MIEADLSLLICGSPLRAATAKTAKPATKPASKAKKPLTNGVSSAKASAVKPSKAASTANDGAKRGQKRAKEIEEEEDELDEEQDTAAPLPDVKKRSAKARAASSEPVGDVEMADGTARPTKRTRRAPTPAGPINSVPRPIQPVHADDITQGVAVEVSTGTSSTSGKGAVLPRKLFVWGSGDAGQFGVGPPEDDKPNKLNKPKPFGNKEISMQIDDGDLGEGGIQIIVGGGMHSVMIDGLGRILTSGAEDYGTLGRKHRGAAGDAEEGTVEKYRATRIASADAAGAALDDQGRLRSWGYFKDGEGRVCFADTDAPGYNREQWYPIALPGIENEHFAAVAAGENHFLALTLVGKVYSWGTNTCYQLGRSSNPRRVSQKFKGEAPKDCDLTPTPITGLAECKRIFCGLTNGFAVEKSGKVVGWGLNTKGQTGTGLKAAKVATPHAIAALSPVRHNGADGGCRSSEATSTPPSCFPTARCTSAATATRASSAYLRDMRLSRVPHRPTPWLVREPTLVPFPAPPSWAPESTKTKDGKTKIVALSAGMRFTLALAADGTLYSWGTTSDDALGHPADDVGGDQSKDTPTAIAHAWPAGRLAHYGRLHRGPALVGDRRQAASGRLRGRSIRFNDVPDVEDPAFWLQMPDAQHMSLTSEAGQSQSELGSTTRIFCDKRPDRAGFRRRPPPKARIALRDAGRIRGFSAGSEHELHLLLCWQLDQSQDGALGSPDAISEKSLAPIGVNFAREGAPSLPGLISAASAHARSRPAAAQLFQNLGPTSPHSQFISALCPIVLPEGRALLPAAPGPTAYPPKRSSLSRIRVAHPPTFTSYICHRSIVVITATPSSQLGTKQSTRPHRHLRRRAASPILHHYVVIEIHPAPSGSTGTVQRLGLPPASRSDDRCTFRPPTPLFAATVHGPIVQYVVLVLISCGVGIAKEAQDVRLRGGLQGQAAVAGHQRDAREPQVPARMPTARQRGGQPVSRRCGQGRHYARVCAAAPVHPLGVQAAQGQGGSECARHLDDQGRRGEGRQDLDLCRCDPGSARHLVFGAVRCQHRHEVAQDKFSETTIGHRADAKGRENAELFFKLFDTPTFKVGIIEDVAGVSLCGALKNVVAIAAGFTDGLGWGDNAKAAVMRIGLMEMKRFSEEFFDGVKPETFTETSAGVADLITTCLGGRNRKCAEAFVKTGKPFDQLEKELAQRAEASGHRNGARGARNSSPPAARWDDYPLFKAVYSIAYEGIDAHDLTSRL
ncbi:hypothetical protein L1887_48048 [Cichorium endivia]|nr:hypothetical protein L1887_48048 [Cichorium endivia]